MSTESYLLTEIQNEQEYLDRLQSIDKPTAEQVDHIYRLQQRLAEQYYQLGLHYQSLLPRGAVCRAAVECYWLAYELAAYMPAWDKLSYHHEHPLISSSELSKSNSNDWQPEDLFMLGLQCWSGWGCDHNAEEAKRLFKAAAEKDYQRADFALRLINHRY